MYRKTAYEVSSSIQVLASRLSFELKRLQGRLPKTQEELTELLIRSLVGGPTLTTYSPGTADSLEDWLRHTEMGILISDAVIQPEDVVVSRGGAPQARNTYVTTEVANFDGCNFEENGQLTPFPPETKGNVLFIRIPNADALVRESDTSLLSSLKQQIPAMLTGAEVEFSTRGTKYHLFLGPNGLKISDRNYQPFEHAKYASVFDTVEKFMTPGP